MFCANNFLNQEEDMNKKMIIAIVAVLGVVLAGTFGFTVVKGIMIKSDPVNHLLYSASQNKYEAVDATMSGKLLIDETALAESMGYFSSDPAAMSKFMSAMFNKVAFTGDVKWKMDLDSKKLYLKEAMSLNYGDKPLLKMGVSIFDEQLLGYSETFSDNTFVLSKKDIFDMIYAESEVDLNALNLDKYIDILKMENDPLFKAFMKDTKVYESILRDNLKSLEKIGKTDVLLSNGKTIKCDTLELSLTMDEMTMLAIDIFNEAKADAELKALVKGKMIEVLNLLISSEDYILLKIELEEITTAIQDIETNFEELWNSTFDEMIFAYQDAQYELGKTMSNDSNYVIRFAIDSKYNLRKMDYSTSVMGIGMEQSITYNAFNEDVKIDEVLDPEKTVNIKQIIEDEVYASEIGMEMLDQGLTNIIEGEALGLIMDDLKTNSALLPEPENQSIMDMVNYFIENKATLKDMILGSMGLDY
jgi:hypothetical protein